MKKFYGYLRKLQFPPISLQLLRVMKLTVVFLTVVSLSISARSFSQTVTYSGKNVSIEKVFSIFQQQTGYSFFYNEDDLNKIQPVSVSFEHVNLKTALNKMLESRGLGYTIQGKTIFVHSVIAPYNIQIPKDIQVKPIEGVVVDSASGEALVGVTIKVKGSTIGALTDAQGKFSLEIPDGAVLEVSYLGYEPEVVSVNGKDNIRISLSETTTGLEQLIVVGYGTQKKKAITGAVSTVTSEKLGVIHNGSTVSKLLAGTVSGVSFREAEGRPGSSASIQIRNMGVPLYVIDGVIQDEGQFNNLASGDIESITFLKGAQAAIYGSRSANGVVVVTTKHGNLNTPLRIGINAYYGWQNLTRYMNNVLTSAWKWKKYAAEAQLNQSGSTNITQEEIEKWKYPQKTQYPVQYQSFDWPGFIFHNNAPQSSINLYASGGGKSTQYYISFTHLNQDAVFNQYNFNRTNAQVNITTQIKDHLTFGVEMSGRIEERKTPGVPGDDYNPPLIAAMRNLPTTHPYANNNPKYLNSLGSHSFTNPAYWTYDIAGKAQNIWRVFQTNLHAAYQLPINGLSLKGQVSYYYGNNLGTNHEFTYKTYSYNPVSNTYDVTGGSSNPYQTRYYQNIVKMRRNAQLDYKKDFGNKHNIEATLGTQWSNSQYRGQRIHNVPPVNELDIVYPNTIDGTSYLDNINETARIGYYSRVNYNYVHKYYLELSGRKDASWKFPPGHRWGFFPAVSGGWRISDEPFFKLLAGSNNPLTNLKLRVAYGQLGDDNIGIDSYAYYTGYNYGESTYIFDNQAINTSEDRGMPITNITWFTSTKFDIGIDFGLWEGKLSGSLDYFRRKRTGLLGNRYIAVIPELLGYSLPQQNQKNDAQIGGEILLTYKDIKDALSYEISVNVGYSRHKVLRTFHPTFANSWNRYRSSSENRWDGLFWGYQVVGQFQSQEQINNYPVNIDGEGNTTLLPGDLIYKDINEDEVINQFDMRPLGIGQYQPILYGGMQFKLGWNGLDLNANFSFGGMNWFNRTSEARLPFQGGGNLIKTFLDRWHREDPRDLNSEWIPGKYPALRYDYPQHSNYVKNSDFWMINTRYLRLRTLAVGYTLPEKWTKKVRLSNVRVYVNTYNLLSFDNMPAYLDPAIGGSNGLQYPQSKMISLGINLKF